MAKLNLTPERSGYAYNQANDVISVELDGGHSRSRRDIVGSAAIIDVQWVLDQAEYQYFRSFFNSQTNRGADKFTIDLVLDQPFVQEYSAKFVPDSVQMADPRGLSFVQNAQLEIIPLDNADMEALVVALFDAGALDGSGMLPALEQLVNTDLEI